MALYDGVLVTETKARGFDYGACACGARSPSSSAPSWPASPSTATARPGCSMSAWRASCCWRRSRCCCPPRRPRAQAAGHVHAPFRIRDLLAPAAVPAVPDGHRPLPGQPLRALQLRHADLARRRHRRRHHQRAVGRERRHRDRADAVRRLAAGAARRLRPDRRSASLPASCAGPAWPSRPSCWALVAAAGAAFLHLRRLPSRRHGLPAARPAGARRGDRPEPLLRARHRRHAGGGLPVLRPALFAATASTRFSA